MHNDCACYGLPGFKTSLGLEASVQDLGFRV